MKLGVAAGFENTRLFRGFEPLLAQHEAVYAPAQDLPALQPDAVLLCMEPMHAAEVLQALFEAGCGVYYAPAMPLWPLPSRQLAALMQEGNIRLILPELFLPDTRSLKKALDSPFVGRVGTVNLLRVHPNAVAAPALVMQDIWPLVWLLGGAQSAFLQSMAGAGKEAAFLSLQMQSGVLASLNAYTGVQGEARVRYDYACQDGVVSYDSGRQPLSIQVDGREEETFPDGEREYAEALRLAWETAVHDGALQNNVFTDGLHVAEMMQVSLDTARVAQKGVGV